MIPHAAHPLAANLCGWTGLGCDGNGHALDNEHMNILTLANDDEVAPLNEVATTEAGTSDGGTDSISSEGGQTLEFGQMNDHGIASFNEAGTAEVEDSHVLEVEPLNIRTSEDDGVPHLDDEATKVGNADGWKAVIGGENNDALGERQQNKTLKSEELTEDGHVENVSGDEDGMASFAHRNDGKDLAGDKTIHAARNGRVLKKTPPSKHSRGNRPTYQDIEPYLKKNMTQEATAERLGVSLSTLKRAWNDLKMGPWLSKKHRAGRKRKYNTEVVSGDKSSPLPCPISARVPGHEPVTECLDASTSSEHRSSDPECYEENQTLAPEEVTRSVEENMTINQNQICHLRDSTESGSGARQDGNSSNLVVKATYKEDTIRFDCSCTSSFGELKKEVGKKFNLDLKKFKMKYLDVDYEWILMTGDFELQDAHVTESSGRKIVRLSIHDL